jgi:hypothetical protein
MHNFLSGRRRGADFRRKKTRRTKARKTGMDNLLLFLRLLRTEPVPVPPFHEEAKS